MPLVWVLILHWRGIEHTRACLESVCKLDYPNCRTLVVDNGSDNNDGLTLKASFAQIECLRLPDNMGFAGGCNAGINYCLERGADYIWLLNNDAVAADNSLSLLIDQAMVSERAGALGAALKEGNAHNGSTINEFSGRGVIDFVRAKTYIRGNLPTDPIVCDWLSGSNLLLNCQAVRQVGAFDERYYLYFEDTDLCLRLRNAGWDCVLVPGARVYHVGNASTTGNRKYWRDYYYTRNRLLFFCSNLSGLQRVPALSNIAFHLARHAIILPFRGESGRKQLRAEALGLRDYLKGDLGRAKCLDWCN